MCLPYLYKKTSHTTPHYPLSKILGLGERIFLWDGPSKLLITSIKLSHEQTNLDQGAKLW